MPERVVTEPTTTRQHIGRCPGCGVGISAEVQLVTLVHPPRLIDGKPQDCAHAVVVASRVDHLCEREVDGEWTYPNEETSDA